MKNQEIELKFPVKDSDHLYDLKQICIKRWPSCSSFFRAMNGKSYYLKTNPPFLRTMPVSWYYDTPDKVLQRRGFDLRVRITPNCPDYFELGLKSAPVPNSFKRHEEEVIMHTSTPDIRLLVDPTSIKAVQGIHYINLEKQFGTEVVRDLYQTNIDGARVEFAFDTVQYLDVRGRVCGVSHELEVEYKGPSAVHGFSVLKKIENTLGLRDVLLAEFASKAATARLVIGA